MCTMGTMTFPMQSSENGDVIAYDPLHVQAHVSDYTMSIACILYILETFKYYLCGLHARSRGSIGNEILAGSFIQIQHELGLRCDPHTC